MNESQLLNETLDHINDDGLLAAQALSNDLVFVTNNIKEFSRIE